MPLDTLANTRGSSIVQISYFAKKKKKPFNLLPQRGKNGHHCSQGHQRRKSSEDFFFEWTFYLVGWVTMEESDQTIKTDDKNNSKKEMLCHQKKEFAPHRANRFFITPFLKRKKKS